MHHLKAIEIRGLKYRYPDGTAALDGLDLTVENCESVAVLGPNGAGKSTLLLHLNGILKGEGEVKIFGLPLNRQNIHEIRRRVGLVFQDPNDQLFSPTVYEDVAFGPMNMGLTPEEVEDRTDRALASVEADELGNRSSFHLSYGQRKRVSIATVLSMQPDILALDEPSSNLDPHGKLKLKEIIKALPVTKLIVTHDLLFAFSLCDRAIILKEGKLAADAPLVDIYRDEALLKENGLDLPPYVRLDFDKRHV